MKRGGEIEGESTMFEYPPKTIISPVSVTMLLLPKCPSFAKVPITAQSRRITPNNGEMGYIFEYCRVFNTR